MVIKLYISGISGNKEVKKKQQRVQMILDSKQIDYEAIDITEPGKEKDKEFMQQNGKVRESLGKHPLPPQIFNDEDFCGDYEDFDLANEVDELEKFLHIETSAKDNETDSKVNGLKEQIINSNDLPGENNHTEDVTKSEVNGECDAALEPPPENISENIETLADEAVAPVEEESSAQENKTNDEKKEDEENIEDNQEPEAEGEAAEEGEEKQGVETPKEDKVENEEASPPSEEREEDVDNEDKEENEEKESDNESPQSEKSQED